MEISLIIQNFVEVKCKPAALCSFVYMAKTANGQSEITKTRETEQNNISGVYISNLTSGREQDVETAWFMSFPLEILHSTSLNTPTGKPCVHFYMN